MKFDWKITCFAIIGFVYFGLLITSCGESETSTVSANYIEFGMRKLADDWIYDFELWEDTETHIQYIIYKTDNGGAAITPRYLKDDGTLYTEGGAE